MWNFKNLEIQFFFEILKFEKSLLPHVNGVYDIQNKVVVYDIRNKNLK
jgi:hypothetical protein